VKDETEQPPPPPPPVDAAEILHEVHKWWDKHAGNFVSRYEKSVFPHKQAPRLTRDDLHDLESRKRWVTVLILGSLHTLGRKRAVQDRDFIRRCDERGWLNIFADKSASAEDWIGILDKYIDEWDEEYKPWIKEFVSIYQISRWLEDYVEFFLSVEHVTEPFALDQITNQRRSSLAQGSDFEAPPAERLLKTGMCFVLREMTRQRLLKTKFVHEHCYVPSKRMKDIFRFLGCDALDPSSNPSDSKVMFRFVADRLGADAATFGLSFDIPFEVIWGDKELQIRFFKDVISSDYFC
jgi:hypothetical protein